MDNWFTSIPLFEQLKDNHNLRAIGTVRKNKKELPEKAKVAAKIESSQFFFNDKLTLVSFTPKKNKIVLVLSSLHHTKDVNESTKKPEIIMYYNKHKGGTDAFDQKCHHFTTSRRTRRWPFF